jgi:hypothetical protein
MPLLAATLYTLGSYRGLVYGFNHTSSILPLSFRGSCPMFPLLAYYMGWRCQSSQARYDGFFFFCPWYCLISANRAFVRPNSSFNRIKAGITLKGAIWFYGNKTIFYTEPVSLRRDNLKVLRVYAVYQGT